MATRLIEVPDPPSDREAAEAAFIVIQYLAEKIGRLEREVSHVKAALAAAQALNAQAAAPEAEERGDG